MSLYARLQNAQANNFRGGGKSVDFDLPSTSSNSTGPLSLSRMPLGAINSNVTQPSIGGFKASQSPFRKRRSSAMSEDEGTEYGFGDTSFTSEANSRRNSLDDGICPELLVTPARTGPSPILEEEEPQESKKIRFDSVEMKRTRNAQQILANVRVVKTINSTQKAPNFGQCSLQLSREQQLQKQISQESRVNSLVRGPVSGQQTLFGLDAKEMTRQSNVPKAPLHNSMIRSGEAGLPTAVTKDSLHIRSETGAQNVISSYRRVNEQFRTDGTAAKLPVDSIELMQAKRNQQNIANASMVNTNARGELVGKKNKFGTDSRQLSQEMQLQQNVAATARVSEQARGELAGQKTNYNSNAREMKRQVAQQSGISEQFRINQQIMSSGVATIDGNSVDISRSRAAQKNSFDVLRVNNQVRSELAGVKHKFGSDSCNMSAASSAQRFLSDNSRVSEQARGELAGQKSNMDNSAMNIVAAGQVPKIGLVNDQIKAVGRGFLPVDMVGLKHVKALQDIEAGERNKKDTHKGKSSFGAGAPIFNYIKQVPKPTAVGNSNIRSETRGSTNINSDSILMKGIMNRPKASGPCNPGMTGHISRDAAQVTHSDKITEWIPESHRIVPFQPKEAVKEVEIEVEEKPEEPAWSMAATGAFGISLNNTSKNFTLERQTKRQKESGTKEGPVDFKAALSRFR